MKIKNSTLYLLVALGIILVLFWTPISAAISPYLAFTSPGTIPSGGTCPSGFVANTDKKTTFTVLDPAIGTNVGTVANGLKVYHSGVLVDTLTTSSGAATTSQPWPTGTVLDVEYISGDNITFSHFTVPCITSDQASQTANIYAPTIYSIGAPDSAGMQIGLVMNGAAQTNSSYYDASTSGTTGVLQVRLDNLNASTGFITGQDFVNGYAGNVYLDIYSYSTNVANGVTVSLTGGNLVSFTRGSVSHWVYAIPTSTINGVADVSQLTNWKSGITYLSTGSTAINLAFDLSSVAATNITITVRGYADLGTFQTNGQWGTNAATYGTFLFGLQP